MYHFQPFPREPGQFTSRTTVPQSVHLNALYYLQRHRQWLIHLQLDSLQKWNGFGDSNPIPFYRLHTVIGKIPTPSTKDIDSDSMEELQWPEENNEPKPEGLLVGDIESTELIRNQFAEADNVVYRIKSEALAQVFLSMRQIRPDGNCGWTALIFSYFEILLRLGDTMRFNDEIKKLKRMNTILSRWYSEDTWVDWWDDTMNLLQATAESMSATGDAIAGLVTAFNDGYTASALIQYFRMIVAAWIQDKADIYEPFVLGETTARSVTDYCRNYLEMHTVEIDGIGISALCDAVFNPAGLAVKIKYLDTSPGAEANTHSLGPLDLNGLPVENLPTIWLLYTIRGPGHYDIIYKPEELVGREAVVMRASDLSYNDEYYWSNLDQIQPRLQNTDFQDKPESHGGIELTDSCWTIPGSTLFGEPTASASGGAYLPSGVRTYFKPCQEEPDATIFAKPSEYSIVRGNGQVKSGTQDAGHFQLLCQESREARLGFSLNTFPVAVFPGRDQSSALTEWPPANLQMEGTSHDVSLLESTKFEVPDASIPTYASVPFQFTEEEPLDVSHGDASGPSVTSEPFIARDTPRFKNRFVFRKTKVQDKYDQLSLDLLTSRNTSKKPLDLHSPANFKRDDWKPVQESFGPIGKAKGEPKPKIPRKN